MLLAIELLDELVGGTRAAARPSIRRDLGLSYAGIGLVLAIPGFVGSALDPPQRARNMARWTLAGSLGYVGGPLLLALAVVAGVGWRGAIAALAVMSLPLAFAAIRFPSPRPWPRSASASGPAPGSSATGCSCPCSAGRRASASSARPQLAALGAYPAFLLVPGLEPKLVLLAALGLLDSGW